jgi:hypothetical protein
MPGKLKTKATPAQAPASKQFAKNPAPDIGRASFTIEEFCKRNDISDGTYTNMRAAGLGPAEMRPTGRTHGVVRISREAELEWIRQSEQRKVSEEEKAADRAKRAGKRGG